MNANGPKGYAGKLLRIDLGTGRLSDEVPDENTLRSYVGGTGISIKYLYEELPPNTSWDAPGNRLIFASGPVGGTRIGGSGSFSVVTKGALTNGATSTQANGFFGAFLKFSGLDGCIVEGMAPNWTYLYIHDGTAELKDGKSLLGKDTWQTEELIKKELKASEHELSVFSIGAAGENMVKFACIVGDRGHVAAHNGAGAVMGSKRLKAIAVRRGKNPVAVADHEKISFLAKEMYEKVTSGGPSQTYAKFGTTGDLGNCMRRLATGQLPVKNYTTNIFPRYVDFCRERIDPLFENKKAPCWACRFNHCRILKVKEGPYSGYMGEEPEYEQWAHWGPGIGQKDPVAAFVLSNEVDRLGMDGNHAGWMISWLMECFEKEIIERKDVDGIDLGWGNVEAAKILLRKIATREGIGDILAKGIVEAKEHFSQEARLLAIFTKKGNTPRGHDHRAIWRMILDTCVSDTGTDEGGSISFRPSAVGLPEKADLFLAEVNAKIVAGSINRMPFDDCLGMCRFNNRGPGVGMEYMAGLLKAVTGWDYTGEEISKVGYRIVNLLRAFNIRHGLTADLDMPSTRYASAPIDGPYQGITIQPVWKEVLGNYYRLMGWDIKTGKPLPQTLKDLGLEFVSKDLW